MGTKKKTWVFNCVVMIMLHTFYVISTQRIKDVVLRFFFPLGDNLSRKNHQKKKEFFLKVILNECPKVPTIPAFLNLHFFVSYSLISQLKLVFFFLLDVRYTTKEK